MFGAVTGNPALGVSVALVYELFWLDLFPAGTYLPPQATASTLAALTLAAWFGFEDPGRIAPLIGLCLPLALIGTSLEERLRRWNDSFYNVLLQGFRERGETRLELGGVVGRSLTRGVALNGLFFLLAMSGLIHATRLLAPFLQPPRAGFPDWSHLWLLASLGAVAALRVRKAYVTLALAVSLAMLGSLGAVWP